MNVQYAIVSRSRNNRVVERPRTEAEAIEGARSLNMTDPDGDYAALKLCASVVPIRS